MITLRKTWVFLVRMNKSNSEQLLPSQKLKRSKKFQCTGGDKTTRVSYRFMAKLQSAILSNWTCLTTSKLTKKSMNTYNKSKNTWFKSGVVYDTHLSSLIKGVFLWVGTINPRNLQNLTRLKSKNLKSKSRKKSKSLKVKVKTKN